ncbi:hypothetical protein BDP27DRAFT_1441362 [Rhodocollybia butyracea]|uniref:Thaumatin-like protein n=1 Tax=Rhodocollybia butyracea TaxID=206335 RepID=A0A9P5UF94_9AGAR|nr:hypothetical protein BDP27DRAFT_1441362 [Rhodocollybia butyracea]
MTNFRLQALFAGLICALSLASSVLATPLLYSRRSGHEFTLINKCNREIQPIFANTACGYSPRCDGAGHYTGAQPDPIAPGATATASAPYAFVGRVFDKTSGECGPSGEGCSIGEFNLDTGSAYTAQAYDLSNIQGFTQGLSIGAAGCDTVTCSSVNCACDQAYPPGDETGCGADLPVRACGPGNIAFTMTFCPDE